jgi:hypothetical protein
MRRLMNPAKDDLREIGFDICRYGYVVDRVASDDNVRRLFPRADY